MVDGDTRHQKQQHRTEPSDRQLVTRARDPATPPDPEPQPAGHFECKPVAGPLCLLSVPQCLCP